MGDPVEFGVDLYRLWMAGQVLLPHVAEVYEQDARDIHNSSFAESEAFQRQGLTSPVFGPWDSLRDGLHMLFNETALTLEACGTSLVWIAREYSMTDSEAAQEMQARINAYLADPTLPQPPEGGLDLEGVDTPVETYIDENGVERPVR